MLSLELNVWSYVIIPLTHLHSNNNKKRKKNLCADRENALWNGKYFITITLITLTLTLILFYFLRKKIFRESGYDWLLAAPPIHIDKNNSYSRKNILTRFSPIKKKIEIDKILFHDSSPIWPASVFAEYIDFNKKSSGQRIKRVRLQCMGIKKKLLCLRRHKIISNENSDFLKF